MRTDVSPGDIPVAQTPQAALVQPGDCPESASACAASGVSGIAMAASGPDGDEATCFVAPWCTSPPTHASTARASQCGRRMGRASARSGRMPRSRRRHASHTAISAPIAGNAQMAHCAAARSLIATSFPLPRLARPDEDDLLPYLLLQTHARIIPFLPS